MVWIREYIGRGYVNLDKFVSLEIGRDCNSWCIYGILPIRQQDEDGDWESYSIALFDTREEAQKYIDEIMLKVNNGNV